MSDEVRKPPPEGWAAFFTEHGPVLVRIAARLVGQDDAEDVVGDSMRKLLVRGLPADANARAYAITTVKNTARDLLKRTNRLADDNTILDTMIGETDIEAAVDNALLADDIEKALAELPEDEAYAIKEKVMKGTHWSDVGDKLGITTNQGVNRVVNRGLARLRKMPRFAELGPSVSTSPAPSSTVRTSGTSS